MALEPWNQLRASRQAELRACPSQQMQLQRKHLQLEKIPAEVLLSLGFEDQDPRLTLRSGSAS